MFEGMTVGQIRDCARNDAAAVLEAYWSTEVPVDPVVIARAMGLSVFDAQLGEDTWGMIVGEDGCTANIYLDKDQAPPRYRFSCAHEVGHYVARKSSLEPSMGFIDKRSGSGAGEPDEIYANEFAASLLLPEEAIREAVDSGLTDFAIASRFAVSPAAVEYRRHLLHLNG